MPRSISARRSPSYSRWRSGKFHVATSAGTRLTAGAVVIAAGVGSFQPRRLALPGVEDFEGKSVHYRVKSAGDFHGRDLLICGGGDSALDWTVALCGKARSLTLVHRRAEFRAAPATVARMRELVAAGKMQFVEGHATALRTASSGALRGALVQTNDGRTIEVAAEQVLAFYGLHPKLGPVAEWGLELERKALKVDTEKFQTSVPGIFAIGDINIYPGKKKLISKRLSRGGARGVRDPAPLVSREAPVPAVHHHQSDHAKATGSRRRFGRGHRLALTRP